MCCAALWVEPMRVNSTLALGIEYIIIDITDRGCKCASTDLSMEQQLHVLLEHPSSPSVLSAVRVTQPIVFSVVLCISLFVLFCQLFQRAFHS